MSTTQQYWPLVLETLKKSVSSTNYKTWLSNLEFGSTSNQGRKLILKVGSGFTKEYIEKKFKTELSQAIARYYPKVLHVDYQIVAKEAIENLIQQEILPFTKLENQIETTKSDDEIGQIKDFLPKRNISNLNPKYTLENFVVNSSNELAVSVAKSIIREPGQHYNPVFLYSSTGMGKTHLLQAIGQKLLEERPEFKIKYTTLETFFNHFISSVQKNKGIDFRDYYRSVDILLIDDIQFIRGKDATQEAFFHTFNELHQQNKQIVIASDRPPRLLEGVEDRLISRFEWGMVADISQPTLEDKIAIFEKKLELTGMKLKKTQITQICANPNLNIRDLEGVLNRVQARLKLLPGAELTDADLLKINPQSQVSGLIQINIGKQPLTTEQVFEAVSKSCNVSKKDILGTSREKNLAEARQIAMWFCKSELELSFPTIGKLFGGKDHTTIMHGYNKIQRVKEDVKIKQKIDYIKQLLGII